MKLSVDEFGKLVDAAMAEIPPPLQRYLENVIVEVEAMPSGEDLAEVGIDDPTELLGLYHGTPLTERGVEFAGALPDRITIYQRNIEQICRSRREIVEEIRTTVLHEIGHHFGLGEDDLFDVGYE
jgi:predicted Zn-dependent protease with MMP-like domain